MALFDLDAATEERIRETDRLYWLIHAEHEREQAMLTADIVKKLRAPFDPEAIKWKIQTNPKEGEEWAVVVAYIDARDVAERLDEATDGNWSNEYAPPHIVAGSYAALMCKLTVCGVTRWDVGTVPIPDRQNDDATKDLHSDALKRAAVQFGVASHVYRFPTVKAKAEKFGRTWYLTFGSQDELTKLAECLVSGQPYPKFQHIKVRGSRYGAEGAQDVEHVPAPAPQPLPPFVPSMPGDTHEQPIRRSAPADAPRPAPLPLSVATPRQVKALERLRDERGIDAESELGQRFGGRTFVELTMDEAGQLLSEWQQRPRKPVVR